MNKDHRTFFLYMISGPVYLSIRSESYTPNAYLMAGSLQLFNSEVDGAIEHSQSIHDEQDARGLDG